jgi:hypothetical protein
MCLLDRPPEELAKYDADHPDLSGIVLAQPPHQQRFSFGHTYNPDKEAFEFKLRHLYTGQTKDDVPSGEWKIWEHGGPVNDRPEAIAAKQIDLDNRVMNVGQLARTINQGIKEAPGQDPRNAKWGYVDYVPNSAELALELNDPAYYFAIYPKEAARSTNTTQRIRQIRVRDVQTPAPTPAPTNPPGSSDPIGPPVQPPLANGPTPIIPVRPDVPNLAGKVTVVDHSVMPGNTGNVPANLMPKKCFTLNVFADYRGLRLREDGTYDAGDYIPTKGLYLVGMEFILVFDPANLLDLIFSVRKGLDRTDPRNNQMLREIVIHIPNIPDTADATKTDALITNVLSLLSAGRQHILRSGWFLGAQK